MNDLQSFCQRLPKVELHAHLNGSLSRNTLEKLHKILNMDWNKSCKNFDKFSSLDECLQIFDLVYSVTTTPKSIYIATCDVVEEFMKDNVIYLELRTTPRAVEGSMTKREYIETVLDALDHCKTKCSKILVKLLISVNRKNGYENAKENIELAIEFFKTHSDYVVGIDLSGDPSSGEAFLDLLNSARESGLKIAAHCAEIPNETEVIDILNFKPDRLGHCTCIHPNLKGSKELFDRLLKSKIPVELCLTSNVKCNTVPSYDNHHFKYLYEEGHPICISTDDKGVFHTTLSRELEILSTTFEIGTDKLYDLSESAIEYIFANNEEKQQLISIFNDFKHCG